MRKGQKWTLGVVSSVWCSVGQPGNVGSANSGAIPQTTESESLGVGLHNWGFHKLHICLKIWFENHWKGENGGRIKWSRDSRSTSSENLCPARRSSPELLELMKQEPRHPTHAANLNIWGFFKSWLYLNCKLVLGFCLYRAINKRSLILHSCTLSKT